MPRDKHKLTYKERVLLAQQLYDMMTKHETWNLSISRDPPESIWFDPSGPPEIKMSNILRINLEIHTGGESGPTPYVCRKP